MQPQVFTITIRSEKAIKKLESLGRKKGEYISRLIETDIRLEEIEKRLKELERK
jgi:signal-transduction protein with cAMP-binding, CBS, and nucleotidyltransferase domain